MLQHFTMLLSSFAFYILLNVTLAQSLLPAEIKSTIVPGSYIIQLKPENDLPANEKSSGKSSHELFRSEAASLNIAVRYEFNDAAFFYGISITVKESLTDAEIRAHLEDLATVASITPVRKIKRPQQPDRNETFVQHPGKPTPPVLFPKVQFSGNINTPLQMTGVNSLHARGIKGRGIKIGIIDTGVDYRHPALGAGFGAGHKIAGGYAFVNDDGDRIESPDPLSICSGGSHGTHVAG